MRVVSQHTHTLVERYHGKVHCSIRCASARLRKGMLPHKKAGPPKEVVGSILRECENSCRAYEFTYLYTSFKGSANSCDGVCVCVCVFQGVTLCVVGFQRRTWPPFRNRVLMGRTWSGACDAAHFWVTCCTATHCRRNSPGRQTPLDDYAPNLFPLNTESYT